MSSDSSDNDSNCTESKEIARLGECEVCGTNAAKYTCPKCEVKTCCLDCVIIHKKELDCDGIRDRTKFIRMKDFTDTDLLSDYRLLEECARFVYGVKRDEKKRFTRIDSMLPFRLLKLKIAANKRGIALQFLAQNFTRHKNNTTKYFPKDNIIKWRVEWVFPNVESEPVKFVDELCPDNKRLSELLDKYLNPDTMPFEGWKQLEFYKSVGYSGVKVLLRAEKVKGSSKKFFELDCSETLAENLCGKCVVEFPIVFVVIKDHAYNFDIVTPEDEFDYEKVETHTTQHSQQKPNDDLAKIETQNIETNSECYSNTPETFSHTNEHYNQNRQNDFRGRGHTNYRGSRSHHRGNQRPFPNGHQNHRDRQNRHATANYNGQHSDTPQTSQNREQIDSPIQNRPWHNRKRPQLLTQVILQKKQEEITKEIKEAKRKRPKNLLFTTGYSSEESLSDSEEETAET